MTPVWPMLELPSRCVGPTPTQTGRGGRRWSAGASRASGLGETSVRSVMQGIIAAGTHIPHYRLDRTEVAAFFGKGGGRGQRSVASYGEDTTTMGVAAARRALAATDLEPQALWFATASRPTSNQRHRSPRRTATRSRDRRPRLRRRRVPAPEPARRSRRRVDTRRRCRSTVDWPPPPMKPPVATAPSGAHRGRHRWSGDRRIPRCRYRNRRVPRARRLPGGDRSRAWEERFGEVTYGPLMSQAWERPLPLRRSPPTTSTS